MQRGALPIPRRRQRLEQLLGGDVRSELQVGLKLREENAR